MGTRKRAETALVPRSVLSSARALAAADPWQAFAQFLRLDTADGEAAPSTLKAYQWAARSFARWATAEGIAPASASVDDVRLYRAALVAEGLARGTIALRLAGLRRFFAALAWAGLRADNPAAGIRAPRERTAAHERVKFLPEDGLRALLAGVTGDSAVQLRDRAILTLFVHHGPRVAELAGLTVDRVDVAGEPGTLRLLGKGSKWRTVYLTATARAVLASWLAVRQPRPGVDTVFLALDRRSPGGPLSARSIRAIVDRQLERAGLKRDGVSCHALRHSFATWSLAAGAKLEAVSDALGHSSLATTSIYAKVGDRIKSNPGAYVEALLRSDASH